MMRPGLQMIVALLAMLVPSELHGQSAGGADTMLARLTAEAMASAPAVQRSVAMARATSTRIRPAGALPDPVLNVGVMDLTLPRFAFRESDFTEVDVELSQRFPWPGTLGAQTRAARATARGALSETSALRREITGRVAAVYYRLRYVATAQQTLARQRVLLESAVEISTARYGTGSVPQSDPLQARVALARLGAEEAALTAEDAELRADLRAVRGVMIQEQLTIAPINLDTLTAILVGVDSSHAAHLAGNDPLANHPRLQARRAGIEAAEETARAEAASGKPDFEISTRYGARPLGADFVSAFVGIRLPLWAGRKQRLLIQAATIDVEVARRGLEEDQAELRAELDRTLADARAGAARLRLLIESVLPITREGVEAALRSYRTGQADFLSVLTAEDVHYRAELEANQVAAEHLTHLVMLDQLLEPENAP
jgi:cobalt-zinc-cadmium efflux system outer membrane protein